MEKAKWIWNNDNETKNNYVEFQNVFVLEKEKDAVLYIATETDYIAYINGKRAGFNSFAGYRNEKYYDVIDITDYCHKGSNIITITVRYEGVNSATHIDDGAGLIFEIVSNGETVSYSSNETLCRTDERYIIGQNRYITGQLGLTSGMKNAQSGEFSNSSETGRRCKLLPRPVKKLIEYEKSDGRKLDIPGRSIFDLGKEDAGYVFLDIECENDTEVKVAYGEHLNDGYVRRIIDGRDFSLDFICRKGRNYFEQLFVRVAGRYLEILCEDQGKIKVNRIGIIPVLYPVTEVKRKFDGIYQSIYDTCVRTLRLCMHTHYEDCPWREQALYVLDSKNQMTCGYYAFEESEFARANLVFMSKGKRPDGMLELTYPAVNTPAIPFFSLNYPVSVTEYIKYTGDKTIIPEVEDTIKGIFKAAEQNKEDGLIRNFPRPYWNFYEWSPGNEGYGDCYDPETGKRRADLILNCAYCIAKETASEFFDIDVSDVPSVRERIRETFYNGQTGMYCDSTISPDNYSQLCQAFAILAGLDGDKVTDGAKGALNVTPATLSMLGFVYDALLKKSETNSDFILKDISSNYRYMLSEGATSFWETIKGSEDFNRAGSLCHGWSAIPIKYLCELLKYE
ncbi:MAG: family 78 glycoside hydrolase catalytic domain [Clostridia bacterium]|nr:family 78 glycoside hydrolase catalytic domain [Clostridia bacterium]